MYDLSRRIVDDGGFVCGCVWNIDMKAHHIVSNKARDLRRMQSSKYVQSDTELCLPQLKAFKRRKGSYVLWHTVSDGRATPFLGNQIYQNLLVFV